MPPGRRVSRMFGASRDVVRIAYRDPEHVAERLTLTVAQRLGEPSLKWAQEALAAPDVQPGVIAAELHRQSAHLARIDGAIAGTPFFIALVPGYVAYLRQEATMVFRTAALYDHDPRELTAAAELLALRGVHPTVQTARGALEAIRATPLPDKPSTRRSLRTWMRSVYSILVLGGFVSPRGGRREHGKLLAAAGILVGLLTWVATWVFPVTLMAVMAWSCERNMRDLGRRALIRYGGSATITRTPRTAGSPERRGRRIVRAIALFLSLAVPIAFVAYADRVRNTTGVNALSAGGALVALSVVIAATVVLNRSKGGQA